MSAELDPFNAFVDLANLPDETHPAGPRLAVKDMIAAAGLKQTCGLPLRAEERARDDAAIVAAFRRAGYRIVGTTTSDNAGFGTMTDATRNPRHPERAVGGSSGGAAAAVAAGLADVGLGTDTGGSVRIPAAYCDLVSLKPSHGRTDMTGIVPLAPPFDVAGIMTRDGRDLAAAAPFLVSGWRSAVDASPARFGYGADAMEFADPPVAEAFTRALAALPHAEPKRDPVPLEPLAEAHSIIVCAEGYKVHGADWRSNPRGFPPVAAGALAFAETLTPRQVSDARALAEEGKAAWQDGLDEDEVLVVPTLPMAPAPRHAETALIRGERYPITNANIRFNLSFNVAGLPVVVAPVGGLSLQFVGAHRRDEWLLATVRDLIDRPC